MRDSDILRKAVSADEEKVFIERAAMDAGQEDRLEIPYEDSDVYIIARILRWI